MDPILDNSIDFTGGSYDNTPYQIGRSNPLPGQDSLALMERNLQEAQERYNALRSQRAPMMQRYQHPTSTPIWDEISRIQDSLSSNQIQFLESNPEYSESFSKVAVILNREYMRMMRPIVESTPDGKQALQRHLDVLKRLVKQAKDAADQQAMLMADYTKNYSHLTFEQYLKMINENKKAKKHEDTNS